MGDAADAQRLAGDRAIADTTLNVPHPYEDGMAEQWIASLHAGFDAGELATFAVVSRDSGELFGAMGLKIQPDSDTGEIGYWVGKPYWGNGYATEAAIEILRYGFSERGLSEISAGHLGRNPASGRVMAKAGMIYQRTDSNATEKWGQPEDLVWYSVTASAWQRP